jgi:predicted RNA-binding protein YlqC (UPF0109 family)
MREADCKDCRREVEQGLRSPEDVNFTYNETWAKNQIDRGGSRSDRCREHRQSHQKHIQGIAVAYVDLETVGQAIGADDVELGPTGPLGGLGPLPGQHLPKPVGTDLGQFGFGMDESHIREMLGYLQNHDQRVLIVKAGTGTGKSTYMPYRLLDPPEGCFRLCELGPIVVTEPRVQATTGVAEFVGTKMSGAEGVGPGYPVGYQVSGDKNHDAACQLIFVTDGTVINWMREGRLNEIGTIIVDEAHERSTNIDFIIGFLKQNIDRYPHLRVIITSATFNADFYVEYFGGAPAGSELRSTVNKVDVPAQKSIGYGFPLFANLDVMSPEDLHDAASSEKWAQACPELPLSENLDAEAFIRTHWKTQKASPFEAGDLSDDLQHEVGDQEDLHETTRKLLPYRYAGPIFALAQWKREMPKLVGDFVTQLVNGLDANGIFGDVLAFLPTTNAIDDACDIIRIGLGDRADVYALLSSLSAEQKKGALDARKKGDKRKIVISSNLAETSLTVEGVRFVVDSGLICQEEWDVESASGGLPTRPHSQSGIKQRWGRVGRKAPGWVFPLYSKGQYVGLPEDTPPGSTRSNLESLVMTAKMGGIDNVIDFPWPAAFEPTTIELDEPARAAQATFRQELQRANDALQKTGAIDGDGHPTSFGKELTRFQGLGSTSSAVAIMYADRLGCVPEVTTLLALMEDQSLSGARGLLADSEDWPPEWRLEAVERHDAIYSACEDDAEAVLQIVSAWERSDPDAPPWEASELRTKFARGLWLNQENLLRMAEQRRDVLQSLSPAMKEEVKRFLEPALLRRARGVLTRAMGALEYRREGTPSGYMPVGGSEDTRASVSDQSRVTGASDRIIPLSRYRDPRTGEHSLSNIVTFEPWAERRGDSAAELAGTADAMDLLLAASSSAQPDTNKDFLAALLLAWPPGTRVRLGFTKDAGNTQRAAVGGVIAPAVLPEPAAEDEIDLDEEDEGELNDAEPGLDTSWPGPNEPEVDNEDVERRLVVDSRPLEAEALACGTCEACLSRDPEQCKFPLELASDDQVVDVLHEWASRATRYVDVTSPPIQVRDAEAIDDLWYEVVGYEVPATGEPAVVVAPDWRLPGVEYRPGEHPDLVPGQTVELRIGERKRDHRSPCRVLYRTDGLGRFVLREVDSRPDKQEEFGLLGASLDRRYQGLIDSLIQGATIRGTAVPRKEPSCYTITLLELLHQHLLAGHRLNSTTRHLGSESLELQGTLVEVPNPAGYGRVRLSLRDPENGIHHEFSFREDDVLAQGDDRWAGANAEPVLISVRPATARLSLKGVELTAARTLADHYSLDVRVVIQQAAGGMDEAGDQSPGGLDDVLLSRRPISGTTARDLERLQPTDDEWRAAVWAFFARSHHMMADNRRPVQKTRAHDPIELPAELLTTPQALEDAIAAIRADAALSGYVVDITSQGPVVNLTPLVSAVVPEEGLDDREHQVGDPVVAVVRDVRPRWGEVHLDLTNTFSAEAELRPSVESIVRINRRRLETESGAAISVRSRPPLVVVSASSDSQLEGAKHSLSVYLNAVTIVVVVPPDKTSVIIGRGGNQIRTLRGLPGMLHCDFDRAADDRLLVGAETIEAMNDALDRLDDLLNKKPDQQAEMVVPPGKNGGLIGRGGETVKALIAESGCTSAWAIDNGQVWTVKGPSMANIERFVELARAEVAGCTLSDASRPQPSTADLATLVLIDPVSGEEVARVSIKPSPAVTFNTSSADPMDLGASVKPSKACTVILLRAEVASPTADNSGMPKPDQADEDLLLLE